MIQNHLKLNESNELILTKKMLSELAFDVTDNKAISFYFSISNEYKGHMMIIPTNLKNKRILQISVYGKNYKLIQRKESIVKVDDVFRSMLNTYSFSTEKGASIEFTVRV